jgi:hypothetical protein
MEKQDFSVFKDVSGPAVAEAFMKVLEAVTESGDHDVHGWEERVFREVDHQVNMGVTCKVAREIDQLVMKHGAEGIAKYLKHVHIAAAPELNLAGTSVQSPVPMMFMPTSGSFQTSSQTQTTPPEWDEKAIRNAHGEVIGRSTYEYHPGPNPLSLGREGLVFESERLEALLDKDQDHRFLSDEQYRLVSREYTQVVNELYKRNAPRTP